MAECSVIGRVLWCPKHVALHKVVVAAELVQVHVRGSDHPDVVAGEPAAQDEGNLLQTPAEPLGTVWLKRHLLLEVLLIQRTRTRELAAIVFRPLLLRLKIQILLKVINSLTIVIITKEIIRAIKTMLL